MEFLQILIIALGLAMDAFAVSIAAGTSRNITGERAALRLSLHFGLFQFLMPWIGWSLGINIAPLIASGDHWVAFILLAIVGGRMIKASLDKQPRSFKTDPSKGMLLFVLSVATSIDALAVGLSIGMLKIKILFPSLLIGIITALLSYIGIQMGKRLGLKFGKRMELLGGFLLIGIGVKILIAHLS